MGGSAGSFLAPVANCRSEPQSTVARSPKNCESGVCTRDRMIGLVPGSALKKLVDEGLVGFGLLGGESAETREERRSDTDGNELLGISRLGTANAAGTVEFRVGGFRDIREINAAVRNMLCVLCGLPGAR